MVARSPDRRLARDPYMMLFECDRKRPRGSDEPRGRFSVSKNLRGKLLYPKNIPIFVSLRGRSAAVAILKSKVWHPVAKHGSTKQAGILIAKNMSFAVSFRLTIFRYGMTNRIVKDCRVAALLAMTKSVGLIENTERIIQSSDSVKCFLPDKKTAWKRKLPSRFARVL